MSLVTPAEFWHRSAPDLKYNIAVRILLYVALQIFRAGAYLFQGPPSFRIILNRSRELDVTVEKVRIPTRECNFYNSAYLYRPSRVERGAKLPVIVNWHGCAYIVPWHGKDADYCIKACKQLNAMIIDVDYSKAPSRPYPACILDAEDTVRWVFSRKHEFDLTRVAFSGFSSGGFLALSAAASLSTVKVPALVAFYPSVDLTLGSRQRPSPSIEMLDPLRMQNCSWLKVKTLQSARSRQDLVAGNVMSLSLLSLIKEALCPWSAIPNELQHGLNSFIDVDPSPFKDTSCFFASGQLDNLHDEGMRFISKQVSSTEEYGENRNGSHHSRFVSIESVGHLWDRDFYRISSNEARKEVEKLCDAIYSEAFAFIQSAWDRNSSKK